MTELTHLLFVDVETTGHDVTKRQDAIVEVAAALLKLSDLTVVNSFETLIRPEPGAYQAIPTDQGWIWDLGEFHQKGRHFDGVDWMTGQPLKEALAFLAERILPGATLTGQNPSFDIEHLRRDFVACGIPWPEVDYHVIDIAVPSVFLVMAGKVPGLSLKHTRQWAGLTGPQKHRAMPDVLDELAVFRAQYKVFQAGLSTCTTI